MSLIDDVCSCGNDEFLTRQTPVVCLNAKYLLAPFCCSFNYSSQISTANSITSVVLIDLYGEIGGIKKEIVSLGHIHPGSLSMQKRVRGGEYWHLSYSHAGKGHTEYVRKSDLSAVQEELKNHKRFRELISEWIDLEIELSKISRKSRCKSMKSGQSL